MVVRQRTLLSFCFPVDVGKVILDKCTLSPPNFPDPEEPHYSVMFNYEFVEDFQNEQQSDRYGVVCCGYIHVMINSLVSFCSDGERRPNGRKKFDEKHSYGCGYMEVRQAKRECFTTRWGPVKFSKENHPLWIMVRVFSWSNLASIGD